MQACTSDETTVVAEHFLDLEKNSDSQGSIADQPVESKQDLQLGSSPTRFLTDKLKGLGRCGALTPGYAISWFRNLTHQRWMSDRRSAAVSTFIVIMSTLTTAS